MAESAPVLGTLGFAAPALAIAFCAALGTSLFLALPPATIAGRFVHRGVWTAADLTSALSPVVIAVSFRTGASQPPLLPELTLAAWLFPRLLLQCSAALRSEWRRLHRPMGLVGVSDERCLVSAALPSAAPALAGAAASAAAWAVSEGIVPLLLTAGDRPTLAGELAASVAFDRRTGLPAGALVTYVTGAALVLHLAAHALWRQAGRPARELWWPRPPDGGPLRTTPLQGPGPGPITVALSVLSCGVGGLLLMLTAGLVLSQAAASVAAVGPSRSTLLVTLRLLVAAVCLALPLGLVLARGRPAWLALTSLPSIVWAFAAAPFEAAEAAACLALAAWLAPQAGSVLQAQERATRISGVFLLAGSGVGAAAPVLFLAADAAPPLSAAVASSALSGGAPAGALAVLVSISIVLRLLARGAERFERASLTARPATA